MSLIREKTANNRDRTSNVFFRVMMFSLQTSTLFRVTWGGEENKKASKNHWNFPSLAPCPAHTPD